MRSSWIFGTLILGLIPLLSRFIVAVLVSPISWKFVLSPIDISFLALAFNWSNINESCRLFAQKKKKNKQDQIKEHTLYINLGSSVIFIIIIAFILMGLYTNEKISKELINYKLAGIIAGIICVISGIISFIFIGKINNIVYESK